MQERETLNINSSGHLQIGGVDCLTLAREFGTPVYVLDEAYIRKVCRGYKKILNEKYPNSLICYASKALSAQAVYAIVQEEGLGADVVSSGELYTAATAGFDMSNVYVHGNNKLPRELEMALGYDVHAIVVDGESELEMLDEICARLNKKARVLIRVNPGIEAHTHKFIQTAKVDSKFGSALADGTAEALIVKIFKNPHFEFLGFHCHIGSQIFELAPFAMAVDKLVDFAKNLKVKYGIEVSEFNLGGGYGIHYLDSDKPYGPEKYVETVVDRLLDCLADCDLTPPKLVLEPGRSIVGEAGITLYTVGTIKRIKGVKTYVAVDGGMFENPRPMLYQAEYEAAVAACPQDPPTEKVSIAGKCCESSDILIEDIMLPKVHTGDVIAVFSTGAYNYSMASHYNRNFVPPVVLVADGKAEYIVRPETLEDVIAHDVMPKKFLKG